MQPLLIPLLILATIWPQQALGDEEADSRLVILKAERVAVEAELAGALEKFNAATDKEAARREVARLQSNIVELNQEIAGIRTKPQKQEIKTVGAKVEVAHEKQPKPKAGAHEAWDVFNDF